MRERWGSCTTVDRTIRISDRLNGSPDYVLACVLFHELIHLRIPDHSAEFYALMERFPDKARAEAWLEGFEAGIALLPDAPVQN
jgi:predicted metal-dependent hydrolase